MKKRFKSRLFFITLPVLLVSATASAADRNYPIAGIKPYARPAGAPVVNAVVHRQDWYNHALTGVTRPYPESLHFLENQGNWYTPFTRPGMRGRYDIRHWHTQ
ncbi:MAG TPA: hypothetical protein ENJ84_00520 [Gammaproteobacteria bacterium]|nr:hypothetical protein [Gammaproteobacteria bacterium]